MITKHQKKVLDFIKSYTKKKGYAPSLEDIKKKIGFASVSTAHHYVKKLQENGYLKKQSHLPRAIEIYESEPMLQINILGNIAAGQPIEAIEEKESIAIPKIKLPQSGEFYGLRVVGDSMTEENINDGDIVIVKSQPTANNGQKVVALIDNNEVTLKKIYKEKNRIRLQPANAKLDPIYVEPENLMVQGVVIDVIKNVSDRKEKKITEEEQKKTVKTGDIKKYLNTIFQGDIMELLKKLPDKSIDMIFGDPDYNVGIKYGENTYTKSFAEYIDWYIELVKESMRVLKDDGNLFIMNYPKQNAHLRVKYLDNEYPLITENVWVYNSNVGHSPKRFTTAHRTILHVRKTKDNKFYKDNVALPYQNPTDRRILQNLKNGSKGRMPYTWYYFDLVKNVSKEKTYHACQIPQKLTEMLIKSCTMPEDIVLILFGGSGAELEMCKKFKRQYISAEIDPKYYEIITDRLKNGYIKPQYKLQLGKNKREEAPSPLPLFSKAG